MKPRIFIGSSSEGLKKATAIRDSLSDVADCQLWNEGFFENNKSTFESLAESSTLFDFAILVATKDDLQQKRDKLEVVVRDNVILEFGLSIGRLGRARAFFIKEKGLDLPSDLHGITLLEFKTNAKEKGKTLKEVCENLKNDIKEKWQRFELSFVPSTVLAIGYFENFVVNVSRELMQSAKRRVNEKDFGNYKLHIVIPDELPNNFQDQVISYLNTKKLSKMEVETTTRKYNFYLDYSQSEDTILELYDLPTTLGALKKAIELAIPKSYVGESDRERILKRKEMNNFCRTLEYLKNENAITKAHVHIDFIDVNPEKISS